MKKTVITLAALLGLSVAAPALAQSVDFDTIDANMDGVVSFEELQVALPAITQEDFDILDTDGDGVLSREEFAVLLEAPAAQ
ncbi:EF-hand domain-containing protein [Pelagibacterium limicola]|uniref:EF-hand domain-containing protein n=1 Tax=Pelagibacterium limicola TaxID=2791022 RepID=UPI0018AFC83F|nr:EF-hand domain-containing protein [Pelagibacterium limicola]